MIKLINTKKIWTDQEEYTKFLETKLNQCIEHINELEEMIDVHKEHFIKRKNNE